MCHLPKKRLAMYSLTDQGRSLLLAVLGESEKVIS